MRWERLFSEIQHSLTDEAKLEHESLAGDLRDEEWAATRWSDVLGGTVELDVRGHGRMVGSIDLLGADALAMGASIIRLSAIETLKGGQRANSPEASSLTWRTLLRALIDEEGPNVRVTTSSGGQVTGEIEALGADHLAVSTVVVPWDQISVVASLTW